MNKKQRAKRDEVAALSAVHMAIEQGKKVGIGVDDLIRVERMVGRVTRIAEKEGHRFEVEKISGGVNVKFSKGIVYVFAADKLTGNPGN